MTIKEIRKLFTPLSDGFRVVLLVHRSKEGGFNNTHRRHLKKIITRNSQEFFDTIAELKEFMDKDERTLRIYSTANSCDLSKAIRLFKQRQLDRDYETLELRDQFYLDLKNQFISCLMDNSCRVTKNFLFDLDECDDRSFRQIYERIKKHTEIVLSYPTKNGYHIIAVPFNLAKLDDDNLIKSAQGHNLMLVDY